MAHTPTPPAAPDDREAAATYPGTPGTLSVPGASASASTPRGPAAPPDPAPGPSPETGGPEGPTALVVLSGGQDSTTCLYWALERFGAGRVAALTFDYGQRHRIELECARRVAEGAGVPHALLPIDTFAALGGNALTADIPVQSGTQPTTGLPNTFVPGRNLVFLTFAAAYAYPRGIRHLVAGVAQTDYSGYPDCRAATLQALEQALRLGMDFDFTLHTPLMHLSKADTVRLAVRLGALPAMALTHTCYRGRRPPCGTCPACLLRARGFAEAGVADPLVESPAGGGG